MPVAPTYIDYFKVKNRTKNPITLGDLVNVLVPAGQTVDLLKQPRVTKEKINQSQHLQIAVKNGWLTISKPSKKRKTKRERQATVSDEIYEDAISLGELTNVTLSGVDEDDLLQYEGGEWVNKPPVEVDISLNVTSQTSDYTATETDDVMLVTTGSTNKTVSFPSASTLPGKVYHTKKIDNGSGNVILDPSGTETIDDQTTVTIDQQYTDVKICSDGSNWWIL